MKITTKAAAYSVAIFRVVLTQVDLRPIRLRDGSETWSLQDAILSYDEDQCDVEAFVQYARANGTLGVGQRSESYLVQQDFTDGADPQILALVEKYRPIADRVIGFAAEQVIE